MATQDVTLTQGRCRRNAIPGDYELFSSQYDSNYRSASGEEAEIIVDVYVKKGTTWESTPPAKVTLNDTP